MDEPKQCPICLENKQLQIIPCQNTNVCKECWIKVCSTTTEKKRCPICFNCLYKIDGRT